VTGAIRSLGTCAQENEYRHIGLGPVNAVRVNSTWGGVGVRVVRPVTEEQKTNNWC